MNTDENVEYNYIFNKYQMSEIDPRDCIVL